MTPTPPKIQDHAVIGDGRSAALVSHRGVIDWLCWPRFDSPSLFAGLLDGRAGGSWGIGPVGPAQMHRCYVHETNVFQTRFETETGSVALTDFMPAASEAHKRQMLWPEQELVRLLACEQGAVEVQVHFDPRPDFGRVCAGLRDAGKLGLRLELGSCLLTLRSDVPLTPAAEGGASGQARIRAGEVVAFSLSRATDGPAVVPPLGDVVRDKLAVTIRWWQDWAGRASYHGPYRHAVTRSALALRLLCYCPSGALIAALTTSLPEVPGGDANWDYRFCWLRDASFTVRALLNLGYREEAEAFVSWLLHATRLTLPELRIFYDVYGESGGTETTLAHLEGYANSGPVRIGNAARAQLQLDVYGEVVEAVRQCVAGGLPLDRETRKVLQGFGDYICRHGHEPDSGIWEPRGPRQHYTHSRLLCWVALDRLLDLHRQGRLPGIAVQQYTEQRNLLRAEIECQGWNDELESYTQVLGGSTLDASLLLLALHDFEPAAGWRMQRTQACLQQRLAAHRGWLYRNEEKRGEGEGAFAVCGFWHAEFLARGGGTLDEARGVFERALAQGNDLGLFAEEADPETGDLLGNFPQAYTHVGLINAALALAEREEKERPRCGLSA